MRVPQLLHGDDRARRNVRRILQEKIRVVTPCDADRPVEYCSTGVCRHNGTEPCGVLIPAGRILVWLDRSRRRDSILGWVKRRRTQPTLGEPYLIGNWCIGTRRLATGVDL